MAAIGRILLMPRGDYDGDATYNMLDWVRNNGAAWVCKVDGTTGITPSSSATTNWALLAEDGSIGGWTSLGGKPFETIGSNLDVNNDDELFVDVATAIASGNTHPVTSGAVYTKFNDGMNALGDVNISSVQDGQILEYDGTSSKWINGDKISSIARYGGTKTWSQLTSSLLVAGNVDKFYLCTDGGTISGVDASHWVLSAGSVIPPDSHIAVINYGTDANPDYRFDDFGGYVDISGKADRTELDYYTDTQTQSNGQVVFDNLEPNVGYEINYVTTSTGNLSIPKWTNINKTSGTNLNTIKLTYTISGGTDGSSKFRLRIMK